MSYNTLGCFQTCIDSLKMSDSEDVTECFKYQQGICNEIKHAREDQVSTAESIIAINPIIFRPIFTHQETGF